MDGCWLLHQISLVEEMLIPSEYYNHWNLCVKLCLLSVSVCFFVILLTEENVELEKARQEWEALDNVQPGQTHHVICFKMKMTLFYF